MKMKTLEQRENLIASLAEGLEPVRQFKIRDGALLVALAVAMTGLGVFFIRGFWHGMFLGEAAPFFWVTNGLLLLLGLAAATAVITMASPNVGNRYDAPRWAAAMVAVLPLAALISGFSGGDVSHSTAHVVGVHCVESSLIAATLTGGALIAWLRRGAPVSLNLAGWLTGLAAGGLGTVAFGLSCPLDTVMHLGVSHILPVAISAVVGRLIVPPLVRW